MTPEQLLLIECVKTYIIQDRKVADVPLYLPIGRVEASLIEWAIDQGLMERCPYSTKDRYWFVTEAATLSLEDIATLK